MVQYDVLDLPLYRSSLKGTNHYVRSLYKLGRTKQKDNKQFSRKND